MGTRIVRTVNSRRNSIQQRCCSQLRESSGWFALRFPLPFLPALKDRLSSRYLMKKRVVRTISAPV